jgi:hypothetical protein
MVRATILGDDGRVVATAHKSIRTFAGGDFEKAETGAIGRALSACGYGTIEALDMDEGEDISDSPVTRAVVAEAPPAAPNGHADTPAPVATLHAGTAYAGWYLSPSVLANDWRPSGLSSHST